MSVNQNRINSVELGTSHKQSKHSPIKRYIIGNNWLYESVRVPSKDPIFSIRNWTREIQKSLFGCKNKLTTDPSILKTNFYIGRLSKSPTLLYRVDQDLEFRWFW